MPPQGCENLYLVDHIGRLSLRAVDGENGAAGGFSWRFDPQLWPKMDRSVVMESEVDLQNAKCPLALIWGQHSLLVPDEAIAYARSYAPPGTPMCAVPDAQHHLMLDQPLATIAAVRTLLSAWP